MTATTPPDTRILPKTRLNELLHLLRDDGFEVIGPRIEQQAIVYGPIKTANDLPRGWTDRQEPGSYRLEKRHDDLLFGYAVGPQSWKKYVFPPTLKLWQAQRKAEGFAVESALPTAPARALFGMRSCELHALAVQDKVFMNRAAGFTDPYYAEARARLFLVGVDCEHLAGTCFCVSMGTGPAIETPNAASRPAPSASVPAAKISLPICGSESADSSPLPHFDLALTELADAFTIRSGSPAGQAVIDRLDLPAASPADLDDARRRVASAAARMGRTLDTTDVRGLLHRNQENPRWDDVADRCLSCTNCTMVCPTCFCSSVEDVTDLSGDSAERVRRWDSCFNPDFAGVHGGNFRPSVRGRYRQWLTHKFASWHDQFDVSGCVGCGRCITWCPVGIDVTVEITALRATDGQIERALP